MQTRNTGIYRSIYMVLLYAIIFSIFPTKCIPADRVELALSDSGKARMHTTRCDTGTPVCNDPYKDLYDRDPLSDLTAASAILVDAESGQVLYSRKPDVKRPNASTTKIMTALLLIENCSLDETICASKKAEKTPYTSIHLKENEKISAKDILYGLMVRSANDAAVAIAEHVAGSTERFSEMMNEKARELGCSNTHFVTPNGLYHADHYSSARDLAKITRYALSYRVFNDVVSTKKYKLDSRTKNREDLVVFTRSDFKKHYPGADGVKTGYVRQAGKCFVGSATRDGWRLISVVLDSQAPAGETARLMDYGFEKFEKTTVVKAGSICGRTKVLDGTSDFVDLSTRYDLRIVAPKGRKVDTQFQVAAARAPVAQGDKLGKVLARVDGQPVCSQDVFATRTVETATRPSGIFFTLGALGVLGLVAVFKYGRKTTKDTFSGWRRFSP